MVENQAAQDIKITRRDSSDLTLEELVETRELIDKGYDYKAKRHDKRDDNVLEEYGFDDGTSKYVKNCLARTPEGKVVGSIGVKIMAAGGDDDGRVLWNELHKSAPELWKRAGERGRGKADENRVAAHVWGAVVSPDARGQRLGTRLYQQLAAELNPPIIEGQTKTPAAVASRVSIPGYRHFYGTTEVTPRPKSNEAELDEPIPPLPPEAIAVLKAYQIANERQASPDWGGWHIGSDTLNNGVPDTEGFPPEIRAAFIPLQFEQARMLKEGVTKETAVLPLISIRADLFDDMMAESAVSSNAVGIEAGIGAPVAAPIVAESTGSA
jgi:ribosomal protein S18 acetylase RimI-like enzyme